MDKSNWQISIENNPPCQGIQMKRRITKDNPETGHKKGEIVELIRYGTFGAWDTENRFVDFYNCERV